ncbi:proliferation marker protein Ki-67 isoform X1 [Cricetulus griseus]|uniref:proliferation marker protein Ki-67 isoform X1 n=1 Tax=Cricetulus griseus TaxID=10029 RepID=UPI0015C3FA42|nr:proliferation marker protein Ki-67 isoform X1 [Cricetulus griseus]
MASSARLVTIKRSGGDGAHFPLSLSSCLFGRSIECDIRIQLPVVSKKHCKIEVNKQQAILYNFSSTNPAQVNGATIDEPVQLKHGDIITIIDRSFRYENGNHEDGSGSTGFPEKSLGQEPARRASRASFSDDSDGKGQDAKSSKTTASRRSSVHDKKFLGDSSASDGSKDSVTQDLSNTCSSGHVEQHSGRNLGESTSSDLFKKSRATGSSYRELKSSPAHSLSNSKKNESPFEKLYQSMKEELDIKSQKPSRRKSEPQPECAAEKEMWETKLLVSCKSRAKSSGSTPETAPSSPKVGKVWTENQNSAVRPLQTSTEALSSSFSLAETAKTKTPVRTSQQLEDFHVSSRRESVNLDESEGAKAVHKIVTPRKSGTRNQTPVKVEYAASPADTPENLFSKKRRSIPAKVEVLSAETQNRSSSIQHLAPGEKKTPKEAFSKPEKLATAAEQICSGLPGLSSVDISNFGDSINKSEGMSLKRRRVSFGGRLRPELFDENLPPNTPLKRGETPIKRKSLAPHTPAVLKKIIKERPQSPGKLESPGVTPPTANDERRRSGRILPASDGSKSLHQTDTPKKAGRKSGNLPAKRASISRSQHDILQMICSKRRSGASEANLIVAKSWADVVKLGAKQTQTKVVKHVPQKQTSKRQRRPNTPKKPTSNLHNQFSTGHANSPCTIVIGRAQIEKVSMPARPYKMLNNLMLNRKMDFNEDLSGLTEMFKTPVKENQQQMNDKASILSNSGNLPEKQFEVTNSENKPLPSTSEILGENVLSSTQNAAKEPSNKYFASPTLRRRSIKNGNTVQTPKNDHDIAHVEKKTPGSVTEPLKTVSSVNKLRRSRELRHTLVESMNENTEAGLAKGITGRHLRKTSLQGQEVDQQMQDSENTSQRFKEIIELKEVTEKTSAKRSCAREKKPTKDSMGSQMTTQTAACAEELFNQEKGTIETPEESMRMQNIPMSDGRRDAKEKVDLVYETKVKCWSRTPDKKAQPLEGPAGLKEPFETPSCREKPMGDDKTKVFCKSPQPTPENTKTSTKPWPSTSGRRVDMKEEHSALNFVDVSGGTRYTPKVQEHRGIKALKESENQMLDLTVTGSKKPVRKVKEKTQPLENLDGFQELSLSPVPADKITKMPNKSPCVERIRTPASRKSLSKTGVGKVEVTEELSTSGKRTESPGRATRTPTAPALEESDSTDIMQTPKQKLVFTGNSTGRKRRSQAPKNGAQPLEDLDGFQELFQTPVGTRDPVTVRETTKLSLESAQAEPVRTPASRKSLSKTGVGKVEVTEELSTSGKRTKSPGRATRTPTAPALEESNSTDIMETPKQKLDFTTNSTGRKSRSQAPKNRVQSLEDLDGFQELFQTPVGASDPVTVRKTTKLSLESVQAEPVRIPASRKSLSKTDLRKEDLREELSTLGKRTKSSGRATHTPTAPALEESDSTDIMQTPKQKLVFTGNSTGRKRRSQAPKNRVQSPKEKVLPLEDLDGFQELFQTPAGASDPVTVRKTTKLSLESAQAEPVRTPASRKRLSKTDLGKVDVTEEVSTLGKRTKSSGRATRTPTVLEESDSTDIMQTPNQKLVFTANSTGRKRRSQAPKNGAQPLEDLDGFQELFQTPVGAGDPVTVRETTKLSLESAQAEPVRTPASRKRLSKTDPGKVDVTEVSTLGKRTKSPGRAAHTSTAPVQQEKGIKAIMETSGQELKSVGNLRGPKKHPRTPKEEGQSLEDLFGLQELFQTPDHGNGLLAVGITKKKSINALQPETVIITQSLKRQSRACVGNIEVKEELSESEKHPQIEKAIDTLQGPDNNNVRASKQSGKRKLDSEASMPDSKRLRRASKDKTPRLEDLHGFQQLFQTPGHAKDSLSIGETSKIPTKSPQSGPVRRQSSRKSLPKMSLWKMNVTEDLSALWKQSPGKAPTSPVQQDNGIQAIVKTPKGKLETAANVTGLTRQRRAPKEKVLPLEDLDGFQELFQIPDHSTDPVIDNKRTSVSLKSPQPVLVRTTQTSERLAKTSLGKVGVREEISLNMPRCAAGESVHIPSLPEDDGRGKKDLKKSRTQTLGPSASVTRSKKQQGSHKERSQSPEDLFGLQELFQTPASQKDLMTVCETTKMSLESSEPEHIRTPASRKSLSKTGVGKVDVRKELSTSGKRTESPGRATRTPTAPALEESDITDIMQTPKQKLDFTTNSTGRKRRSQAPKNGAQPLEDLDGFQELFQTPVGASDPVNIGKTAKVSLESVQAEPVRTPASRKRLSKTDLGKVDVTEEVSTLGKRTKSPGRTTRTPTVLEESDSTDIMQTPKQKLDFTENSTGRKRRSQAPKNRVQSLEDLDGFQELFQTPVGASDPVTVRETTELSLESVQAEPVRTPASRKRLSKTGVGKVEVTEELSTLGKRTKSPGRAIRTPIAPALEESDSTDIMQTPKQKLDFTGNSIGRKRRSQAPKNGAQPLEDLDGFQELFQTPVGASDPVTVRETTKLSLESVQAEPVRTPASRKRLSKTDPGKVDATEEVSTLGKRTKSPGRATCTPTASALEESDSIDIMETPKQKVDFTRSSRSRSSQATKNRAQSLEDLDGFQELFQTPVGASDPVNIGKTAKVSLESVQAEPVRTPVSTKRLSKTGLDKVDAREKHSLLSKPRCSSQEVMRVSRLSEDDGSGTKDLKESAAQALDPAISVTRSKRQRGACKKRSQSPEDLFGLQELFQTPGYEKDSVAGEKLTKMPHSSLPPEPTETSITSQRQPRTRLMKVHVKNELSGDRMLPQMSQEIMDISRVPEGEDKGISTRKQSVKRKLDTAVSVPSSKRQRVARAEKAQTLEGLPGFQELSQTPSSAVDSVTVDKTTKMLSKSPESMDTTSQTQPGRRLRRVGVTKEPIAQRKTTRVLRGTRNTPKEPVGDSKDVKEFKDSSQKQGPTVSLTGKRSQSRTLKEKTQPLEELPSIQEETATRYSCESPQPEEKESSVASERQLRIRLCKIDMKEEPTTQRKPPGRKTRNTPKEPVSDSGNVEELKESTKQKTDPAASVPASKRPRRVLREKAQPLELPGPKGPGHTEESANDERPTQIPCSSPQPEQVDSLPISPRRPRTRRGKVEVDEVPSLVRKAVPSSRQTSRSRKVPEIDDKDIQASKEPGKQKLETVTTVTASRRQLRGPKDGVQSLEVLGESKEITQMSEHTEKLRHDTNSLKSTLQQMPVPIKPLRTSRRVLRASKEDTTETTLEMVVDTRDSAESQSKSITFLPPKRKSARDGSIPRTRGLRSVTPKQEATDEKPAPKKQRTASSKRHVSPEPVKMKQLRIMSNKIEPVEEQISNITEEKEAQVENSAHPDQKTPLPSRYRKKTNEKQPRPEVGVSAEKVGIKKNEKTVKTSQETELQNTDDGAKKSTSRGKVSGKRICLRSGGQSEIPQPHAAEEKTSETGAEILVKTQKEKGISGDSDVRCLRSRKTGATLDSEPKPRVTRGAKKDTKVPKKDEDIVYTTKLRTRSHQNSKNV